MTPKVSQGVTTVITGNCGISLAHSPAPRRAPTPPLDLLDNDGGWFRFPSFRAYREELEAQPAAINAACLVGHTTFRVATMDRLDRAATPAEIAKMRAMAHESLASGAIGVSTGTAYPPAACAPTEEIIEVCRPLTEFGGLYVTHMRNEDDQVTESMEETCLIGRTLSVPVVISHHKTVGTRKPRPLARNAGADRRAHARASRWGSTAIRTSRRRPCCATTGSSNRRASSSRGRSRIPSSPASISTKSRAGSKMTKAEAVEAIKPAGAIYFMLDEKDVQRILAFDETMIGSDGLPHDAKAASAAVGHVPARARPLLARPEALSARDRGLQDDGAHRGQVRARRARRAAGRRARRHHAFRRRHRDRRGGLRAFDAARARHRHRDRQRRSGLWRDGKPTGARPGRVLLRA